MRVKNITWKLTRPRAILAIKKEQDVGILFSDDFFVRLKYINVIDFIDQDETFN